MKIKIEIKDGKFVYKYRIGLSKQEGNMHLSTKALLIFCRVIELCACASDRDAKDKLNKLTDEIGAKAWIDRNLVQATDYLIKKTSTSEE